MKILNFKNYNKSWWQKIVNFFTPSPDISDKTEYADELKTYGIKMVAVDKKDEQNIQLKHGGRVVGEIKLNSTTNFKYPIWDLYVYYYESEIPQTKKLKKPENFPSQSEQPYGRARESFPVNSDNAVRTFLDWWINKTVSGRKLNPKYKIKRF